MSSSSSTPSSFSSSSQTINPIHLSYCSLCDATFANLQQLRGHINSPCATGDHPWCNYCRIGFLNKNSYRLHLMFSEYHHYCEDCELHFESRRAKEFHMSLSVFHNRDCDGEREKRPEGWENAMARDLDALESREDPLHPSSTYGSPKPSMSRVNFGKALLRLKEKQLRQREAESEALSRPLALTPSTPYHFQRKVRQTCPVCLCAATKLSATRCGHVFCTPCIRQTFDKSQGCPSCRTLGAVGQLRRLEIVT